MTTVEGVRENSLMGYGLVVGLHGTGDQQQTIFTTQMLANLLLRHGPAVVPPAIMVKNVAAVLVTWSMPAFTRAGTQIDVLSLRSETPNRWRAEPSCSPPCAAKMARSMPRRRVRSLSAATRWRRRSHQAAQPSHRRTHRQRCDCRTRSRSRSAQPRLALLVAARSRFRNAERVAFCINTEFGRPIASATDSRRIEVASAGENVPALLARIQALPVQIVSPTRVVINEKTGTIVMGRDARLSAASILQGSLSIEIATTFEVSQPNPVQQNRRNRRSTPDHGERP